MQDLNRQHGQTFVIVTHDAAIASVCNRVVQMQDGLIVADGAPIAEPAPVSALETWAPAAAQQEVAS